MSKELVLSERDIALVEQLRTQHPAHAIVGDIWEMVGGTQWAANWARENPGGYMKILMSATPTVSPMNHVQGDVVLHVHPSLAQEKEVVDEQ
jgi:hypothetical protein